MNDQISAACGGTPRRPRLAITLLLAPMLLLGWTPIARAQFTLSQSPPISYSQDPAPNVILSLDDSGSMGWDTPTRMSSLKAALRAQFGDGTAAKKGKIPDGSIRLAWQTMWDNGKTSRPVGQQNDQSKLVPGAVNSLKSFEGTHRTAFENFVVSMKASNGTPSHRIMTNVRNYMSTASGINSPFASKPTVTESPVLSCRRTYHIFMTDGEWNSETTSGTGAIGDFDNGRVWNPSTSTQQNWTTLPDGTVYTPTSDQVRTYRDAHGGNLGTLADWALANWATDFSAAANDATPLWRTTGDTQTITSSLSGVSASTVLQRYWNPKNNPMTWQGVTQHTIGFGSDATSWTGKPDWNDTTDDNYGGDFNQLVNGQVNWQNVISTTNARTSELWHMALNGRGKFYPARSPAALEAAFNEILGGILLDSTKPLTGISANTSNLRTDSQAFVAGYDTLKWSGSLKAYKLAVTGTLVGTPSWAAETYLDGLSTTALDSRKIFTHTGSAAAPFVWGSLSGTQETALGGSDATLGENRVKYLRGDRSLEATGTMRSRDSRLGDIVNSQPWYTHGKPRSGLNAYTGYSAFAETNKTRSPMIYIGANDGMLHGFNTATGHEMFAYVPRGVYANLAALTIPGYLHRYYVDGNAFTGDAHFGGSATDWKTVLVGTLGNGGKGYFLLDVTNPAAFGATNVLADRSDGSDPDIGHMVLTPVRNDGDASLTDQIVKTNDGKWSVIMGNGFNSTNARPVLLVQALTTAGIAAAPVKVVAGTTAANDAGDGNGLSSPRLVDMNADGKVDVAYAGDMKGNLWRFDLTDSSPASWSAKKLYTAVDAGGKVQPISAAPMWKIHPKGGLMVMFGTGRNFANGDATNADVQSLYGIWDISTRYTPAITLQNPVAFTGRSRLVEQSHTTTVTNAGVTYYKVSDNTVTYALSATSTATTLVADSASALGWYLDIPLTGHRVVNQLSTFDRNLVKVQTLLPSRSSSGGLDESCGSTKVLGDESLLYVIDIYSGAPSSKNIFNVSADIGALKLPSGHTTLNIDQGKDVILVEPVPPELPSSCTPGGTCLCPVGLPCPCDKNGDGKCDKNDQSRLTRFWGPRIPSASYIEY